MVLLDILLISAIMFGSGYVTRYMNEPVKICKEIVPDVPQTLTSSKEFTRCFEGYTDGILDECKIPLPRLIMPEDEGIEFIERSKQRRIYLKDTVDLVEEYNKNKYIFK